MNRNTNSIFSSVDNSASSWLTLGPIESAIGFGAAGTREAKATTIADAAPRMRKQLVIMIEMLRRNSQTRKSEPPRFC